ncbi:outer membrane protein assembly factor BamA [Marinimicrobium alkaliphilum]|uniref:outer membrane protein assembly factor BamA n=1 Tax=Marinimicrobium alkaliphilum TaxID=2202654 RepID=UPI0018E09B1E|nr:outer membrane protein assembly factor BamA [Marinimicrobium alkaliphilum]
MQNVMRILACLLLLTVSVVVQAQSFRVSDIRVEGLQRVSAGTVFSALPIRVGDTPDQADIQEATRELFRVGYFTDIAMARDGDVLVVTVTERPAINEITIEGNRVIQTEALMESLHDNGLSEGQIFQRATLDGISQALEREYVAQGRYGASVTVEIEDLPRNQVRIKIDVNEGKVATIKHINIVGNDAYSDDDLLDFFELRTTGLFSFITGDHRYSREKMTGDIERLESWYLDRGYLDFSVDSTQVALSPDKSQVFITINITEGEIYTISGVELAGDPKIPESHVRNLIFMQEGDTFSQQLMTLSSEYITRRLGNEGYTFASVEGMPEPNREDNTVEITFFIDPGQRAYVRRVNFKGNNRTIDEVLRREMRQIEGASASTSLIEFSKVRLERLGFFKEVTADTIEVPGTSDQVDVEYTVEEQPSGSMGLQIGYAQYTGLMFGANIQQNNWFGTGKQVGMSINTSRWQDVYRFDYNDPYFTIDGVSRGYSLYYQKRDFARYGVASFGTNTFGAKVRFGYPVSEIERIGFDLGFRDLELTTGQFAVQEIFTSPRLRDGVNGYITQSDALAMQQDQANEIDYPPGTYPLYPIQEDMVPEGRGFIDENGDRFRDFIAELYWVRSTLNRPMLATRGAQQRLGLEISTPLGDLEYLKLDYSAQGHFPLTNQLTLRLRTRLGYAESYGDTSQLPFFEHFYAGGFGSVRGFDRNTLGPRSTPAEVYITQAAAWEDVNGDGQQQNNELSQPAYVLCEAEETLVAGNTVCRPGQFISERRQIQTLRRERGNPFGGNILLEGGAEVIFPLPFIQDQRMLQATAFIDAGNVFSTNCGPEQLNCYDVDPSNISAAGGLGLTWITGFGPMTFSVARPIRKNDIERAKFFQFSLGGAF